VRKISIVVDNRTNWTKAKTICEEVEANLDLELQLIFTSTLEEDILHKRFSPEQSFIRIPAFGRSMVGISSDLINGLEEVWDKNRPDIVVALTDRFETLAVAQTAALMNIHIAHVQGGEVSGTIDESIRHAVTKLSHIHFVSNLDAKQRVIRLGEDLEFVFDVGCPSIDLLPRTDTKCLIKKPYILVLMHPVTTEVTQNARSVFEAVINQARELDSEIALIGPNHDLGYEGIQDEMNSFENPPPHYWESTEPEIFHSLMKHCSVMVGNSSAGIREAGYFGVPVVDCGTRQQFRIRGRNVITIADLSKPDGVKSAIEAQLNHGPYEPVQLCGNGTAGKQISDLLATIELPNLQKRIRF